MDRKIETYSEELFEKIKHVNEYGQYGTGSESVPCHADG